MIHTFELLLVVTYFDIRHLFSMYGIKVDKYHYFGAAVEQLNEEIKKVFPSYAVSYIWDQATGDCNLQLKVDAVKMLSRGTIVEDDYVLVEADIRKFLTWHFGQSDYFDSHVLTRIDYKQDCYVPDSKDRKLLFHLLEKYTNSYRHKEKIKWGKDENGNPFKYETSQYHKNKSVEFVIYSKEDERLAKGEEIQSYDENVVRYELRLKNRHLNSMKRTDKGVGRPKQLKTYFSLQLQQEYMEKHILPIVHKGDYYKITEAEKIIENSQFSRRKKASLREFLVMISKGSIDTPLKKKKEEGGISKPTYRQYLRDLSSLGINPILIPKNLSTENHTSFPSYLKNPFTI
ncbi:MULTISPECIES: phage/plasmid replication domain-containing protein [Bacillus]|uniref:phage/plasmid replication domain-containing protein n=1 Tax=Bacillus TaxID=1386 RepID=UPI00031C8233|nr:MULTISPECIES: phage/plasmid replication protein [Bacillus]HWO76107.1 phage/plasmid replication protein [Bacillus sp. (in: firmicutes)]HZG72878.1 phage/plasmid replication protein [Chondromyces sp.]KAA0815883.1 hypothetical protein EI978_00755 [Bacillus licheniformis]KAA0819385.1 hypothetical protein EI976_21470 [Bacillus licheniformis]KAA0844738.1 hypothetical protein EI973_01200 [Bacillus licheniformis]